MKSDQLILLTCLLGLMSVSMNSIAAGTGAAAPTAGLVQIAAAPADNEDEEDDEEEEAVDYRDRVREIKQWMNRRDTERKGGAPTLSPTPPPQFPKYFRDNGYDGNGYRKLEPDVRIRLRDAPEAVPEAAANETFPPPHDRRQHSWRQRWSRHVHPYLRSHIRHGYHHAYSRHRYSEGVSRHHGGHSAHHERAYAGHAASKHATMKARAKPAGHSKTTSKSAKKSRSRR